MNLNLLPSEQAALVATVDPDALTATDHTSDWVDMGKFESILAIVLLGDLGAEAEVTAKLEQATDSDGTGAKDITGKAITTATHSPPDSDKQMLINCRAEELDLDNSFRYVRLSMTVATATSDGAGLILGFNPRQLPASDNDLASVDEIVT
ncbi:MAG TPA: hypothetical protein VGA88_00910 [Burkholderiales bacterium]